MIPRISLRARAAAFARRALPVLGVAMLGTRAASAQFGIDELEISIRPTGQPGAVIRAIPIRSFADTSQQILLELADWSRDSLGTNITHPYGSEPRSCRGHLELFPQTLLLGPRSTEAARVTYTPSDSVDAEGCWAIVLARTVRPPAPTGARQAVTITTVIGVKVYVHARNAAPAGEVISADVETGYEPSAEGDSVFFRRVAIRFANTGKAHLALKSKVELRDESSQLIREFDAADAYLTPGSFRDLLIPVPALAAGRYVAVVLLDYGGDEITAAQIELEIP